VQLAVLLQRPLLKELFSADCAGVGGVAVSSPVVNLNKLAKNVFRFKFIFRQLANIEIWEQIIYIHLENCGTN